MTFRPDRNQAGIIGVDLPAFLLSKSFVPDPFGGPDSHRGILLAEDRAIFSNDCRQKPPLKYKTRRRAPGLAASYSSGFARSSTRSNPC